MRVCAALTTQFFAALFLLLTLTALCRAAPPVQDIFVGGGTPGPFALRWSAVEVGTEQVSVNGQAQLRGIDYTLDSAAGTVTFTRAVPVSSAVSVAYTLVPGRSQRSGGGQTIPLSLDLLRTGHGYFSLDALGRQAADAPSSLTLGFGLGWQNGSRSQFSSRFVFAPSAAGSGADGRTDRTGLRLGGSASAGSWGRFSLGFSRAGAGLDPGAGDGLEAGRQVLSLGGSLTPANSVQAQISVSRTDPLPHADAEAGVTRAALSLSATPGQATKLAANFSETDTDGRGATQTVALSADTQPTKTLGVSAAFRARNAPGAAGDTSVISLKTVLTPSRAYTVQAGAEQAQSGPATVSRESVTVSLTPEPRVSLQAGIALRQTAGPPAAGGAGVPLGTSTATVGGTLRPAPMLELSGTYKSRTASGAETNSSALLDTSAARIAFAPVGTLKLVGTYAQNPDDGGDTVQRVARRGLSLETRVGALGLSGGCDWSRAFGDTADAQTLRADLGLRFSAATRLSLGYAAQQAARDPSAPPATVYTVGFTHTLGDRFSLSLTGKRRQDAASSATPDYNAAASLGMKF